MKRLVIIAISFGALIFHSCEPTATFDKPQPDDVRSLTSFPKRLQGNYFDADHASVLTIDDRQITRHADFDIYVHKDSLSTSLKLAGDTLINLTDGSREIVQLKGDTVIQHQNSIDTLFRISSDNVLKKFKGYYFLNNRYHDDVWDVTKLSLRKGVLTVGVVSAKDDIQKLKEISETSEDTTSTHFTLTRRQFKKFVRNDGFKEQESFTRIAENRR